jgi:hypothetical protein
MNGMQGAPSGRVGKMEYFHLPFTGMPPAFHKPRLEYRHCFLQGPQGSLKDLREPGATIAFHGRSSTHGRLRMWHHPPNQTLPEQGIPPLRRQNRS